MSTSRDSTNLPFAEVVHLRTLVAQLQQERAARLEQAIPALEAEVSRKHQAEAALKATEQQYQLLYNDNPSMYFTLSQEGTVLSVNRFGADQLGYHAEALIGQSVLKVFLPEDHQTVLGQLIVCASSPSKLFQWDIQKIRQDGTRIWVRERARAIHDQDGRVLILVVCEDITVQRTSEEHMRRTTQALQTLVQMSPLAVMALDDSGETVTLWNQAAESMFGWTAAEVLGRPVPFLSSDQREESDRLFDEFLRQGYLSGVELRRRRRDGSPIDLALWATVLKDAHGIGTGTLGFLADITGRKQVESSLRDSEDRWRALFEHAGVGIAQIGLDGQFLRVNARLCQTLGYASKTLQQQTFQALTHPDDLEPNRQLLNVLVSGTRPSCTMEKRYLRSDGIWLWANLTVSLVRAASGAPAYFIAVVEDISERKQAEEALRLSEIQWQRFVADAPVGMVIVDEHHCLLKANKAFCALTGYDEHEVIGNSIALYTHPDDLASDLELMDEFFEGKRTGYTYEKRYVRKCGEIIWVSVRTTKMALPGHADPLLLAVVENITERKQATEERERLSQDLHDDVLQSLYAIGMGLELTQQRVKLRSRTAAKRLEGSVAQLNNVIREVRSFIPRVQPPTTLSATFDHAILALVESLTVNGVGKIALDIDDTIAQTLTPMQCTHFLSIAREALSNSLRHARAGHRTLTLRRSRGQIRLTISDDGIGFRLATHSSNGMGLRNMQSRARKMGATFTIASRLGKGTQVRLSLPPALRQNRSKKAATRRRLRRHRSQPG